MVIPRWDPEGLGVVVGSKYWDTSKQVCPEVHWFDDHYDDMAYHYTSDKLRLHDRAS